MAEADALQSLLERLCQGDAEAARHAFVTYEPYLRMVVRRQLTAALRSKFDSLDVVQSIWADLIGGFRSGSWCFDTPAQLQAFLVRATRNRLVDRVRSQRLAIRREHRVDASELQSLPHPHTGAAGEGLEAQELWERMLALCPPQHRGLLELKRQGLPLAEIATRTGLHESSVRRVLYELAARLAAGSGAPPGGI
jgi:RNA polymerase sigma-70 factor (ECF subfamily)